MNDTDLLREMSRQLASGDEEAVRQLAERALQARLPAKTILDEGLIAGMNVVGEQFRRHEIFLPDVLLAARAMSAGIEVLKPALLAEKVASRGKIVLGTVQGDLHDIGKNLVGIMLQGAGFEVIDLGNDVAPGRFVETAIREGAAVIGMSALLTTTMGVMKQVVDLVRGQGLDGKVKVVVGGAPLSEDFAREIGADAYGYDAANAVDRVKSLLAVR